MVMPASRMLSAISFGVFCRSAPSTSAIMRSRKVEPGAAVMRTLIQSETHLRAAGHRRAVAAGFADDRRRFAGDRRLVDRGDALDHLAVGGNDIAGLDQHHLARPELAGVRRRNQTGLLVDDQLGLGLVAGLAQACGLRLAAALGDGFGEIGEQHGEPQPDDDLEGEAEMLAAVQPVRGRRGPWSARRRSRPRTSPGCSSAVRGSSLTKAEPIAGTTILGSVSAVTGIRLRI